MAGGYLQKVALMVLFLMLVFVHAQPASAADDNGSVTTKRVAVVCIDKYGSAEASETVTRQVRRHFTMPFESIVRVYERLPDSQIPLQYNKKTRVDETYIRDVAARTHADIVAAVELTDYSTWTMTSFFDGDIYEQSDVELRFHLFELERNRYMAKKLSRNYKGEQSVASGRGNLLQDLLYEIEGILRKEIPHKPPGKTT